MTKINKEGWEIKKLGEVASFLGGGTPSKKNDAYYTGDIPWATVRDMVSFELSETEYHITPEAVEESATNIIPKGTIVISTHVGLGKICVLMQDTAINQDLKAVIFNDEGAQLKGYFAYWYKSIADFIVSNGKGATVKGVTLDFMRNLPIPLPPLPIQRRIVEELDEINAIISAKKQQLTKLDELAQSIFYDMFGDPVANEKGWEVKKLNDVVKFAQGMQVPIENQKLEKSKGDVRFLRIIDFTQGKDAPRYISEFDKKCFITKDDIAIVRYGTPGFVCTNKEGVIANNLFRIIPTSKVFEGKTFLQYWLNSNAFQAVVKGNQYGAALQAIKFSTIKDLIIILPPLPLQETFATRISAIEDQKSVITASIEKMQTLLDARMQEYFG